METCFDIVSRLILITEQFKMLKQWANLSFYLIKTARSVLSHNSTHVFVGLSFYKKNPNHFMLTVLPLFTVIYLVGSGREDWYSHWLSVPGVGGLCHLAEETLREHQLRQAPELAGPTLISPTL
jgi:hypothetical protein